MSPHETIVDVRGLTVQYGRRQEPVIEGLNLEVFSGETLGLVGESGSGKSTLAKVLVGMFPPTAGEISIAASTIAARQRLRPHERRAIQLIPQDPFSSLNPRMTVGEAIAEAIDPRRPTPGRRRTEIQQWLDRVQLPADAAVRYPHEFSGGQRQRIAIARALAARPKVIIADEITSALDVSVQAQVLDLLDEIRHDLQPTMIFISHNLAVVRQVSDRVAVMRGGEIVELAESDTLFTHPLHPYTIDLLDSIPGSPGFRLMDSGRNG